MTTLQVNRDTTKTVSKGKDLPWIFMKTLYCLLPDED